MWDWCVLRTIYVAALRLLWVEQRQSRIDQPHLVTTSDSRHRWSVQPEYAPALGESPLGYPRRATLSAPRYRRTDCAGSAKA